MYNLSNLCQRDLRWATCFLAKKLHLFGQKTCSLKILALLLPRSDGLSQQSTKNPYSFLPSVKVGTNFTQPHQLPPEPWQSHTGDQNLLFACLSLLSKTETLTKKNQDRCVLNTQLTHLCKDRHLPSARWGKHTAYYSHEHYPKQARFASLL